MKTGPSPFIITFPIYSMKTGRHYVILQSRVFQPTNSFTEQMSYVFFKVSLIYHIHTPPFTQGQNQSLLISFIYLFIYLFIIFACVGSSLLHAGFLQLR